MRNFILLCLALLLGACTESPTQPTKHVTTTVYDCQNWGMSQEEAASVTVVDSAAVCGDGQPAPMVALAWTTESAACPFPTTPEEIQSIRRVHGCLRISH